MNEETYLNGVGIMTLAWATGALAVDIHDLIWSEEQIMSKTSPPIIMFTPFAIMGSIAWPILGPAAVLACGIRVGQKILHS